jgi:regulatory protein
MEKRPLKTITKIEVQKRNPKRRSIYVDDVFVAGVDEEVATELGLREGATIDDETLQRALLAEEKRRARESAYRYLARRAHSEHELREKLHRRGFPGSIIEEILADLRDRGYLDDLEFSRSFVRNQMAMRPMGERGLRSALRRKGVADDIIDTVVQETFSETDPLAVAIVIARKRLSSYTGLDPQKAKQRLANLLLRRGFDYEVVGEVLRDVMHTSEP